MIAPLASPAFVGTVEPDSLLSPLPGIDILALAATVGRREYAGTRSRNRLSEQTIKPSSDDFDAFFVANYDDLHRALTAAFGDSERAAEAVQDAFMRAYGRWGRVRRLDSPSAWVRRVAINRLRDLHRKAERQRRAERSAAELVPVAAPSSGTASGDIVALLAALPERQRTAMALYYVADVSVRDIATSMGISEGAVKAHLSQGRANVAARIDADAVSPEAALEGGAAHG